MNEEALVDEYAPLFDETMQEADKHDEPNIETEGLEVEEIETETQSAETHNDDDVHEEEPEVETVDLDGLVKLTIDGEDTHVSVKDLQAGYEDKRRLDEQSLVIETARQEMVKQHSLTLEALQLAQLESKLILDEAEKEDWANMGAEEYKAKRMNQERLQAKVKSIEEKINQVQSLKTEAEDRHKQEVVRRNVDRLQREVAGFNQDMYSQALGFGVSHLGIDKDVALGLTDAGIIKLLIEAHQSHIKPTQVKSTKMPSKTTKKTAPVKPNRDELIDGMPAYVQDLF